LKERMHTRVFFRVNASKGVSKINIWQDLNVRFGSLADYFPDITPTAAFGV